MVCLKTNIPILRQSIPCVLTSFRLVALPFLVYSFFLDMKIIVYFLFLCSIGTDLLDGFVARKLGVSSKSGAFFDVIVDFLFIYILFIAFMIKGFYPTWLLLLLVFVFEQFVLTSLYSKQPIYDPIGKYLGSLFFCGIGLTLLFSEPLVFSIVTIGIVFSTTASILSRLIYFTFKGSKQR